MSLHAERITKRFGGVVANDAIDLEITDGQVHALLGQNGAGKSTLVSILTGCLAPDGGRVLIDGVPLALGNPHAAAWRGIATVFQDLMLVPSMTGLENIALGLRVAANRATRALAEAVQKEFDLSVDLDVPVADLELAEQQRVELIRVLAQRPRILLMDEPTSLLRPTEISAFLRRIRELARAGLGVLLITHRLNEVREIADAVTVIRRGRVVSRYTRDELPANEKLAAKMVGVELRTRTEISEPADTAILDVENLSVLDDRKHLAVDAVSLTVRRGEIVGLAGVDRNGQLELLEAVAGLRRVVAGRIRFRGMDITTLGCTDRYEAGLFLTSGDRQRDGIVPTLSVAEHFAYPVGAEAPANLPEVLRRYGVDPAVPSYRADRLSGGNQQKMLLARAGERAGHLLLLAYPTVGLDVQAVAAVRDILIDRAGRGAAILVSSSELDELLAMCHRVVVMNRGRVAGEQERPNFRSQQLAEWFTTSPIAGAC